MIAALAPIIGTILLLVLAWNGTIKSVFVAVDDTAKATGEGAKALKQALKPETLIGLVIVLLIVVPLFSHGRG